MIIKDGNFKKIVYETISGPEKFDMIIKCCDKSFISAMMDSVGYYDSMGMGIGEGKMEITYVKK